MKRLFGTDGVRGVANRELTPDLSYKLGFAGAVVLAGETKHKPKILVGSDTRISCPMLEAALTSGICSAGADVIVCGVIPTPAVAYLTKFYHCDAGVMISASHNSYEFNGIKFFSGDGFKLPDKTEDEIELLVQNYDENTVTRPIGDAVGHKIDCTQATREYVEHIKRSMSVDLTGLSIAIDCANGAASHIAESLFSDLGATVNMVSNQPDGININDGCGSTHIHHVAKFVKEFHCDLGLAFDGDADRLLAVDENGQLMNGDIILAIIAEDMMTRKELKRDTIVVTVMSNLGLDIMAKDNRIVLEKTKVGDRYVLEKMLSDGYNLGGEQSGHVILLDHSTTGDGILTALALLRVLVRKRKKMSEIARIVNILPQVLLPARIPEDKKSLALSDQDLCRLIQEHEKTLRDRGRILVRASGTEPLIRVMIEGENTEQITKMAEEMVSLLESRYRT